MRYLLLSVLVVCVIGVMIPSVFASDHTDTSAYGTVETEKSQYELTGGQSVYVKVFGTIENPGSSTEKVYIELTEPDGNKLSMSVTKTSTGYYETVMPVSHKNLGQYRVDATHNNNHVGSITFSVVDKYQAERDRVAAEAAEAEARAKAAAEAEARAKVAAEAAAAQAERERLEQERLEQERLAEKVKQEKEQAQLPKIESDNPKRDIEFYLHKAQAFGIAGYWGESMKYFDYALTLAKPGTSQYQEIREEKERVYGYTEPYYQILENDASTNSQKGYAYVALGEYEKGLALCSPALKKDSEDRAAFICQLGASLKLDRYEEVLKLYKHYPHLTGQISLSWQGGGGMAIPPNVIAHYHLGHYDEAYEILEITIAHVSEGYIQRATYALAQVVVLEKQGKGDLGSIILSQLVNNQETRETLQSFSNSYNIDYDKIRGWVYYSMKDYDKAIEYLEKAKEETEMGPDVWVPILKVLAYYESDKRSTVKQLENVIAGSDDLIYGGCGEGTVLIDGVCRLAPSTQAKSIFGSIEPIYLIIGAVAIGGTVAGVIAVIKRGSKTPRPARQELDEYEEQYLAKEKPKRKPAEKKETSSSCSNCGNTLKPTAKFCGGCGTKV